MNSLTPYDCLDQKVIMFCFGNEEVKNEILDLCRYSKALCKHQKESELQHYFNSAHVYCRYRSLFPEHKTKILNFLRFQYFPLVKEIIYSENES